MKAKAILSQIFNNMITAQELIDFEKDIEAIYKEGKIRGPIHLRDGNEQKLIDIFQHIHGQDFVFATWSNHHHALCHGIPPEKVKAEILAGRSMSMQFAEHNFYTSAIVGGICPIALGVAKGIKLRRQRQHVWCFIGDMSFFTGIMQESLTYAQNFDLPITFVVEDNAKSVGTPTEHAWGKTCERKISRYLNDDEGYIIKNSKLIYFEYKLSYAHSGIGSWVEFKGF